MIEHSNGYAWKGLVTLVQYSAAQHSRPHRLNRARGDPRLDRIRAGVEELGRRGDVRGHRRVRRRSDGCGIGRGSATAGRRDRDERRVGRTRKLAVLDNELGDVVTGLVRNKRRCGRIGAGECDRAVGGLGDQRPREAQVIAIDIRRGRTIEVDQRADEDRLIRAGIGNRGNVEIEVSPIRCTAYVHAGCTNTHLTAGIRRRKEIREYGSPGVANSQHGIDPDDAGCLDGEAPARNQRSVRTLRGGLPSLICWDDKRRRNCKRIRARTVVVADCKGAQGPSAQ